jgi:hypothetical protein
MALAMGVIDCTEVAEETEIFIVSCFKVLAEDLGMH